MPEIKVLMLLFAHLAQQGACSFAGPIEQNGVTTRTLVCTLVQHVEPNAAPGFVQRR